MRVVNWLRKRLRGLIDAVARFPLTTVFLVAAAIMNAIDINQIERNYLEYLLTFVVGAFLSAAAESAYERFFNKGSARYMLMSFVVLLTAGYYFIIKSAPEYSMSVNIRTGVALFALLIAFIWIPAIKSKVSFNKSFMISFKAFFIALFFSGVIYGGIAIILGATDTLIFSIDYKAFSHSANIIFLLFGPLYFLSLIPLYPGKENMDKHDQLEKIEHAANCPKFLEILISYIIIPLIAVFTLILVVYIVQNISGDFWRDNLLEPMLVSYAITVILVYILASEIENKFAAFFRMVFPKVLVPIVVFQIISSIISLGDTGVTHTRYYVILFGIFAAIAGVLLSFLHVRKNGIVAAILIAFSIVSIVPPVDAFTISKNSQISVLEEVLARNDMLENNEVRPEASIPDKDKEKVTLAMSYLFRMDYVDELPYLPKDFNMYQDFSKVFGFEENYGRDDINTEYIYVSLPHPTAIPIDGYDTLLQFDISMNQEGSKEEVTRFEKAGQSYTLVKVKTEERVKIQLLDEQNKEIIMFSSEEIYNRFFDSPSSKEFLSVEEATFTTENEKATLTIIVQSADIQKGPNYPHKGAIVFALIQIK